MIKFTSNYSKADLKNLIWIHCQSDGLHGDIVLILVTVDSRPTIRNTRMTFETPHIMGTHVHAHTHTHRAAAVHHDVLLTQWSGDAEKSHELYSVNVQCFCFHGNITDYKCFIRLFKKKLRYTHTQKLTMATLVVCCRVRTSSLLTVVSAMPARSSASSSSCCIFLTRVTLLLTCSS